MDVREKLVELIDEFIHNVDLKLWYSEELDEKLADDLITHGVTVQEWISVKDRLPDKHGKPYVCLLTFPYGGQFPYILNWYEYGDNGYVNGRHFQDEGLDGMKVTHWMPLPEAPKGE